MYGVLMSPPIVFIIYCLIVYGLSALSKKFSAKGSDTPYKESPYSCGEVMSENRSQPNYSQFYKFAFFFTIIHVVVLIVATDPRGISFLSLLYMIVTMLSLFMIFRR